MGALFLGFLDFFKVCTRFYRYFVNIRINWVLFYKSLMSYYTTRNHYFPRHSDEGQRKRPHNWCLGKKSEISVSLICQGRKPKVLSTGPNFNTNSGSGKPCELISRLADLHPNLWVSSAAEQESWADLRIHAFSSSGDSTFTAEGQFNTWSSLSLLLANSGDYLEQSRPKSLLLFQNFTHQSGVISLEQALVVLDTNVEIPKAIHHTTEARGVWEAGLMLLLSDHQAHIQ